MVRITGGVARGLELRSPARTGTRPTTDRVRAAIFNILGRWDLAGRRVLDLYAGTGSMGIEALSRGAAWVDFVERDPRQCALLRQNLRSAGFQGHGAVWCTTVERALGQLQGPYHVAFLDPPYSMPGLAATLERLGTGPLLAPGAVVVVEHSKHLALGQRYGALLLAEGPRRYGDTVVDFYVNQGNAPDG